MDAQVDHAIERRILDHREIRSIVLGLMLAMLLAALDQTVIGPALPTIGRELGDIEHLPWIVTAYLLAATAVTPLYGKLSDIHGRRIMLQIAISVFVVGSAVCALAPSTLLLALARAMQGLGGGGLIAISQTIIGDLVPPRQRGRYMIYIASVFLVSSVAGPVLGGFFAEHLHWSAIFWINVPLGLAAGFVTSGRLRLLPRLEGARKLDIAGAALLVCSSSSFMLALSWGGVQYPWSSPRVLSLFAISLVMGALFVWRLLRAEEPLIPLSVLGNRTVAMATLTAFFSMGAFIGLSIYVPVWLETVRGLSASESGLAVTPLMGGTILGSIVSGRSVARLRNYKRLPIAGISLSILALLPLALMGERLSLPQVEGLFFVISMGVGTIFPISTISVQNAVLPHELGTATATMNFLRQLGSALIVSVFGAIVLGLASSGTDGLTLQKVMAHSAEGTPALASAFRLVFAAAAGTLAAGLAFFLAMPQLPLRDKPHGSVETATH